MLVEQVLTKQTKSTIEKEGANIQRRNFVGGALAALFLSSQLSSQRLMAEEKNGEPHDPFILLLNGLYQDVPAGQGPANNLGLSTVNLSDGSYSKTRIYPIYGIPGSEDQDRSIGTFYVQSVGNLCAYHLPGGALAMTFADVPAGAPPGFNALVPFSDGAGGYFLEGTLELAIQEATGVYRDFQGGHNHMVDKLHQLADGGFNEFCFCNISTYQFP
jgi:hypothetical protein